MTEKVDLKKLQNLWKDEPFILVQPLKEEKIIRFKDGGMSVIISDEFFFKGEWIVFKNNGKSVCMFPMKDIERVV